MPNRTHFDKELETLKHQLIEMGDAVRENIKIAVKALETNDGETAGKMKEADRLIDKFERDIEQHALRIILREQPVAVDLRTVTAVLKIITDLERIGDHAADISSLTLAMKDLENKRDLPLIKAMTDKSQIMIEKSIQAFVASDLALARHVITLDDEVDALFSQTRGKIIALIKQDSILADYGIYIMMVAKYLERIADHAVNIAEWIIFSMTGEHKNTRIF